MLAPQLALCLLLAADGGTAAPLAPEVVRQGDTLAKVAKRTLGDEKAAAELVALNAGPDGGVALVPGAALRLPGPDRTLAQSACAAAQNAVRQTEAGAETRAQATTRLKEAQALFNQARYPEAAKAADEAWQLVSTKAKEPTRFAVAVDPAGGTKVTSRSGKAVRVEAEGTAQRVYAGQEVKVEKGKAPAAPEPAHDAPLLAAPEEGAKLKQTDSGRNVPIALSWSEVPGSKGYEVEVTPPAPGKPTRWRAASPRTVLPALPAGSYQWTVRAAFGKGDLGDAAPLRAFLLLDEPLRLDVGTTSWK